MGAVMGDRTNMDLRLEINALEDDLARMVAERDQWKKQADALQDEIDEVALERDRALELLAAWRDWAATGPAAHIFHDTKRFLDYP